MKQRHKQQANGQISRNNLLGCVQRRPLWVQKDERQMKNPPLFSGIGNHYRHIDGTRPDANDTCAALVPSVGIPYPEKHGKQTADCSNCRAKLGIRQVSVHRHSTHCESSQEKPDHRCPIKSQRGTQKFTFRNIDGHIIAHLRPHRISYSHFGKTFHPRTQRATRALTRAAAAGRGPTTAHQRLGTTYLNNDNCLLHAHLIAILYGLNLPAAESLPDAGSRRKMRAIPLCKTDTNSIT